MVAVTPLEPHKGLCLILPNTIGSTVQYAVQHPTHMRTRLQRQYCSLLQTRSSCAQPYELCFNVALLGIKVSAGVGCTTASLIIPQEAAADSLQRCRRAQRCERGV
jgi:hypothetical protein